VSIAAFHLRATGFRTRSITSLRGSTAGSSEADNLALCCLHCNRHKGPNIAGHDTATGDIVRLYHPRRDIWSEHFQLDGTVVVGLTAIGRVTVRVLAMNEPEFLAARRALIQDGVWQPLQ
jgi:hypothetical protein